MAANNKGDVRALKVLLAALSFMLLFFLIPEIASLVRVLPSIDNSAARPMVETGVLEYDWNRRRRSPQLALINGRGDRIQFSCPDRGFRKYWVCPVADDAWRNRKATVRWLDIPIGISGDVAHRVIDVDGDNVANFHATIQSAYAAEISADLFALLTALLVFTPIWLIFYGVLRLVRNKESASPL